MANWREALTRQQRYEAEIDRILAQIGRLEAQTVRQLMALLTDARRQILASLAEVDAERFLAYYLPRLEAEVTRIMRQYQTRYTTYLQDQAGAAWTVGHTFVDAPLAAVGGATVVATLPALDPTWLDILVQYRASLVTHVTDQAIDAITQQLQLGVLGGQTPFAIQREIASILRTQADSAGRFGTVMQRAEVITRTELNRSFNLSTQARQQQLADRLQTLAPELTPRKRWLNAGDARVRPAHRRAGLGWRIYRHG
jgi:hypothetical protein